MSISRRNALAQMFGVGAVSLLASLDAAAQSTTQYAYDVFGRLTQVIYPNGHSVAYTYDTAGNRTAMQVTYFIPITGSGPANLRTLADAAGYTGSTTAVFNFEVGSGVTITGSAGAVSGSTGGAGGIGIDTGTWPSGPTINLAIQSGGIVRGGGGAGGSGYGGPGGAGGDAIYCRCPMTIAILSGATVQGGGGGGGSGGTRFTTSGPPNWYWNFTKTGGGGGGRPNGAGGGGWLEVVNNVPVDIGTSGTAGTTSANGAGGEPSGTGAAGNGGDFAQSGGAGSVPYSGGSATPPGAAGGGGGYCIRKNGYTVTVNNSGTTAGTIG